LPLWSHRNQEGTGRKKKPAVAKKPAGGKKRCSTVGSSHCGLLLRGGRLRRKENRVACEGEVGKKQRGMTVVGVQGVSSKKRALYFPCSNKSQPPCFGESERGGKTPKKVTKLKNQGKARGQKRQRGASWTTRLGRSNTGPLTALDGGERSAFAQGRKGVVEWDLRRSIDERYGTFIIQRLTQGEFL